MLRVITSEGVAEPAVVVYLLGDTINRLNATGSESNVQFTEVN